MVVLFSDGKLSDYEFRGQSTARGVFWKSLAAAQKVRASMTNTHIHCVMTSTGTWFTDKFINSNLCDSVVKVSGIDTSDIMGPALYDCTCGQFPCEYSPNFNETFTLQEYITIAALCGTGTCHL